MKACSYELERMGGMSSVSIDQAMYISFSLMTEQLSKFPFFCDMTNVVVWTVKWFGRSQRPHCQLVDDSVSSNPSCHVVSCL